MAQPPAAKIDRQTTTPFLLKLFYRTGSHHRIEDFHPTLPNPPHVQIYTWPSCTVSELASLISNNLPQLLPSPAIGTRLDFELIFPDLRAPARADGYGRYQKKPLGSCVLGAGGPGISLAENGNGEADVEEGAGAGAEGGRPPLPQNRRPPGFVTGDEERSLQDAKFVIGDYIDCAIFPPLPNGEVAAPPRVNSVVGGRGGGPLPRENGFGGGPAPGGYGGRRGGGGGRFDSGRGGGAGGVPPGEWRRGDVPPGGGGFGRGRGRGRGW